MKKEDLRALAPPIYAHINPYGRFDLDMERRLPIDGGLGGRLSHLAQRQPPRIKRTAGREA
ncbi:MAG: hypothetical protein JO269_04690 [Burkholderiaceae bacterium]|nr:hypothetical protein [Burkholderiaceae bacterium]